MRTPPNPPPLEDLIRRFCGAAAHYLQLELPYSAARKLDQFADLVCLWNRKVNLTGATTKEEVLFNHILDSLAATTIIPKKANTADLGSGAGFPGIPLAILRKDCAFLLVEPRRKRANFLREVQRQLALENVAIAEARAEQLAATHPAAFSTVTSRALGSIDLFLRLAAPLLTSGGLAIAFKGPRAIPDKALFSGFEAPTYHWYSLPGGQRHCLLVFRKGTVSRETLPEPPGTW